MFSLIIETEKVVFTLFGSEDNLRTEIDALELHNNAWILEVAEKHSCGFEQTEKVSARSMNGYSIRTIIGWSNPTNKKELIVKYRLQEVMNMALIEL